MGQKGLYRGSKGIYWGYIGIKEKKMETTIIGYILGLYWSLGLRALSLGFRAWVSPN